ncbi:MAG: hypothetical protein GT600_11175 [Bacteroidales bacterium]|jgi:predicted nucleic-acid-binding Zn-ribbon protein|nr:hypothetical protein [Bacteroidales bacterium]OQB60930.1 MAG: hypothetical protein BWX96_01983 [Bacteroidetes bacterium ADurb.Bin145]HOU02379.1 DUF6452 family protein [Bacteroidales bacterium]HQK68717.1 DUF6452 family protein [Bacteroidales bacterium]
MRKSFLKIISAFLVIIPVFIFSCTPGSCYDETEARVKASMYQSATEKIVAPDSVSLFGLERDSAIYKKTSNITSMLFPLDPTTETCTFLVKINGESDTVTFSYSSYAHFISKECGYTYYFTIEQPVTTNNIIDKIVLTKKTIKTLNEENMRIYY